MNIEKMREEFELHYAEEFSAVRGYKPSPEEMVSMRDGDGYGSDRGYLNGYWKGWQASRESLVISIPVFDDYPASIDAEMRDSLRKAIHAAGVKTK